MVESRSKGKPDIPTPYHLWEHEKSAVTQLFCNNYVIIRSFINKNVFLNIETTETYTDLRIPHYDKSYYRFSPTQ